MFHVECWHEQLSTALMCQIFSITVYPTGLYIKFEAISTYSKEEILN